MIARRDQVFVPHLIVAKDLIAPLGPGGYCLFMTLQDIEQEALGLSEPERARLIASLIDTLGPLETEVSDEEVRQRDIDLEHGAVKPVLHEEFVRGVQDERGR